jgi:hypothetical protein
MTVVVFLRKLRWGALGRTANLRADLIPLLRWPRMAQVTDLNMKTAKLLIHRQILDVEIRFHFTSLPETRNLTPYLTPDT